MKTNIIINFLAILISIIFVGNLRAQDARELLDLEGNWKFKLGDDQHWADPKFNDSKWQEIYVPANWEDEGYPGYDGYAWYRIHFNVEKDWLSKDLLLDLGLIDDIDETYINGQFVDFSGLFPPNYFSTYNVPRKYPVPAGILHAGKDNVIAVRVYDGGGYGGINHGPVGLYERVDFLHPDVALPSTWKFTKGDNMEWKEVNFDDKHWKNVRVPAYWETQGFKDYDGFGWYRVAFNVPEEYRDKDVIILVGKVDDFDETYLNGEKIGRTGARLTEGFEMHYPNSDAYLELRAYTIPAGLLKAGGENILAVRVYDCWLGGGIYDGPIGIITREHYLRYKHSLREPHRWFKRLMEDIFN
jgi:sialate O-acetylesterase